MTRSIIKRSIWSTVVKRSASGREQRAGYYSTPLWEFEIPFYALKDADLEVIAGFVNLLKGAWDTFYFKDPFQRVEGQAVGTGTGAAATFQLSRVWNYWYTENPYFPPFPEGYGEDGSDYSGSGYGVPLWEPPLLYFNGVLQTSGYAISQAGLLTYLAPVGAAVTIDWDFYYLCRLKEDLQDYEYFMFRRWKVDKLVLTTVKP